MAGLYGDMGRQEKVIEFHRRLPEFAPKFAGAGSDLVHVLHHDAAQNAPDHSKTAHAPVSFTLNVP